MEDPWCLRLGVPRHRSWDKNVSASQFIYGVKPGRIDLGVGGDRERRKEERREGRKEERKKGRREGGSTRVCTGDPWTRWLGGMGEGGREKERLDAHLCA